MHLILPAYLGRSAFKACRLSPWIIRLSSNIGEFSPVRDLSLSVSRMRKGTVRWWAYMNCLPLKSSVGMVFSFSWCYIYLLFLYKFI